MEKGSEVIDMILTCDQLMKVMKNCESNYELLDQN